MEPPSAWTPQGVAKKHRNAVLLLVGAFVLEVAAVLTLLAVILATRSTGALVAAALGLAVASLLVGLAFLHYARARMWATMAGVADGALRGMYSPAGPGPRGGERPGGSGGLGGHPGARGGPGPSSSPWPDPTWEPWLGHHHTDHGHQGAYDHGHHHHHGHHDHGHHDPGHHDPGGWSGGWSDSGSSSSDSGSSSSSDSGSSSSSDSGSSSSSSSD